MLVLKGEDEDAALVARVSEFVLGASAVSAGSGLRAAGVVSGVAKLSGEDIGSS